VSCVSALDNLRMDANEVLLDPVLLDALVGARVYDVVQRGSAGD
jgi:hypothetical protein